MGVKRIARALLAAMPFKSIVYGAVRLGRPPERLYRHLHFRGDITVRAAPGVTFRMRHWGNQVENDLFWAGYGRGWEAKSLQIWRQLVQRASFIADVGANTGVYALSAVAMNPRAKVMAVEPVQRVFDRLAHNVRLNGFDIVLERCAASSQDGTAILHDTDTEHVYSASLETSQLGDKATRHVEIETARLDRLFDKHGFTRIDLMKMDVESHEPSALRGMAGRLKTDRPTMLIEILTAEIGRQVQEQIAGLDYRLFAIDEQAGLIEVEQLGASGNRNYLLCDEATAAALEV